MYKANIAVKFIHKNCYEGFVGTGLTADGARKDAERKACDKALNFLDGSAVFVLGPKEYKALDAGTKKMLKEDWAIESR